MITREEDSLLTDDPHRRADGVIDVTDRHIEGMPHLDMCRAVERTCRALSTGR